MAYSRMSLRKWTYRLGDLGNNGNEERVFIGLPWLEDGKTMEHFHILFAFFACHGMRSYSYFHATNENLLSTRVFPRPA